MDRATALNRLSSPLFIRDLVGRTLQSVLNVSSVSVPEASVSADLGGSSNISFDIIDT